MLLRNQTLEAFCQNTVPVICTIRTGSGKVEVLFMFKGFCGGAVQHPIGLPLIQLLGALGDDNKGGKRRGDRGGHLEGGDDRYPAPTMSWLSLTRL